MLTRFCWLSGTNTRQNTRNRFYDGLRCKTRLQDHFYASAAYAAPQALCFALSVAASVPFSVPCHIYFFRFARILLWVRWNSQEVIAATNRLNDYILSEIGTGTRSGIREKIRIDVSRFYRRCYLVNEIINSLHLLRPIRSRTQFRVNVQIFTYKFHINILRILQNFFHS